MLKGLLFSSNPERLESIYAGILHVYQNDVYLHKVYDENLIIATSSYESFDLILLDLQSVSKGLIELCNSSITSPGSIWLVSFDPLNHPESGLHFFKWVSQHPSHPNHQIIDYKYPSQNSNQDAQFKTCIKKIAVPTLEGFIFIEADEILRFEAKGTYTYIFTCNGKKIISSKNLGEYEYHLLGMPFFRIHQSHLINLNKMQRYLKGRGGTVIMEDGTQIEVASRRRNEFIHLFNQNS